MEIRKFYELYPYSRKSFKEELILRYRIIRKILYRLICKIYKNYERELLIIDVGCGNGSLLSYLKNIFPNCEFIGIDISVNALKVAKNRMKDYEFIAASATALPFRDNLFEYAICSEVLEHIPNYKLAINEIFRILRINGKMILTTPNYFHPYIFITTVYYIYFHSKSSRTSQIYDKPIPLNKLISSISPKLEVVFISSFYNNYSLLYQASVKSILLMLVLKIFAILFNYIKFNGLYLLIIAKKHFHSN